MSETNLSIGWMYRTQIESGFKQLDYLLKRYYVKSLFSGQDQYEENKQEENELQSQKIQSTIKEEAYNDSKNITDQIKTPRGLGNTETKSPQNTQSQFSYKTSKLASIQPQLLQNYINDQQSDMMDQIIDEPPEAIQAVDNQKNMTKSLSKFRQLNLESIQSQQSSNMYVSAQNYQEVKDLQQTEKSFKTLQFNDIVYLKFKHESKKETNSEELKSFLVITNTRNQLECVSEQVESLDNPIANFRRCLFQVLNPRQALEIKKHNHYNSVQKKVQRQSLLSLEISSKDENYLQRNKKLQMFEQQLNVKNDNHEDDGDLLVYGKQVMLYHQYSKMFLTFNPQKPAKKNGCIQCTLEKFPNQYSIFRMLPNDYSRRVGDKIFDSDVINIQEIKNSQFFLNVSLTNKMSKQENQQANIGFLQNNVSIQPTPFRGRQQNRIHINASEEQTKFKVKCYISRESLEQTKDQAEDGIAFKTGDIIKIQHLDSGAFLSVSEKKLSRFILTKNCRIQHSHDEVYSGLSDQLFTLRFLDQNKVSSPENFEAIYDSENTNSSYSFWEIQRKDHFDGGDLYSEECFRLKNLATGLFLSRDKGMPSKFSLIWNGKDQDCYFYVKKDKTNNEKKKIYLQDTFKIYNQERKYIHVASNPEKGKMTLSLQPKISGVSLPYLHAFTTTDKKVVDFLEQSLQIYNTLLQFHYFLQCFAITDKLKGNEETVYSYQEAVHQQKKLESEYQYVFSALNDLENILMKDSVDSLQIFQMKQQFLREQKVLELLILIVKLIDVMSHGNRSQQGQKDKSKLIKMNRSVGYKINEKSPQYIVNKHLCQLPVKIFNILYLGSKQNANWSSYIFENDDFFSGQLRYYPKEIGSLLKEAIKNLYNLKGEGAQGDEIVEWVKLLEPLDESKSNILDQTFYIDFISLAMIDPQQKPLQIYQNKCSTELFSKGKGGQSKAIIQFHQDFTNGTYISFYHETPLNEFLNSNSPLNNIGVEINKRDKMAFSLEKMSNDAEKNKSIAPYLNYVSSVLSLLSNLCNGRNKKSLTQIKNTLGINETHIFNALKSTDINISIRTSYFQIYEVIFLDDEPFLTLEKSQNRSYIWKDIEKRFLSRKTAEIFKQLSDQSDVIKSTQNFDQNILPILEEFWERGMPELEIQALNKYQFNNLTLEQQQENQQNAKILLRFVLVVFQVTRIAMDLGQLTTEKIDQIVNQAIQVLNAFINFSKFKSIFQQEHWLKKFFNKIQNYGDLDQELEAIIIEVSNLVRLYLKIKQNLQINQLLKKFYQEYTNQKCRKKFRELQEDFQQIIQDFTIVQKQINFPFKENKKRRVDFLNFIQQNEGQSLSIKDSAFNPYGRNNSNSLNANGNVNNSNSNIISQFNVDKNDGDKKDNLDDDSLIANKIENMMLTFLLSKEKSNISLAYDHIAETMQIAMNHAKFFCEEIQHVELIDGEDELNLYKQLDSNHSENQIVSPIKLEIQVNNLLFDEFNKAKALKNENSSAENILQINNLVDKIVGEFKNKRNSSNAILLSKMQNILRNVRVHKSIANLLNLPSDEKVYHNMFECVISFLIIFCHDNHINKKEILPRFDDLLNLINYNVNTQKLIGLTLQSVCQSELEFKPYLQAIFQKLTSPAITKVGQTHIFEMLLAFLKKIDTPKFQCIQDTIQFQKKIKREGILIPENQQKILNLILQLNIIQPFLDQHKTPSDFQKHFKEGQKVKQDIYLYKSIMKLMSTLSENNQLGIIQCQRILVYEDLKQLLLSAQSPYIIKKEVFKILFQIYIQQYEDQNNGFALVEMNELLQNVVLKDLSQFSRYIEGLVDPNDKYLFEDNKEKGVKLQQKLREFIKDLIEEKSVQIEQKQVLIRKSSNNKEDANIDIIASPKEYWDYLYSGSNWNFSKDGLLQILLDIYREISKRKWLAFETSQENKRGSTDEENLTDHLLSIKIMCENIRFILKKIQNKFQIDLTEITYMFSECIILCSTKKHRTNMSNFKHQSQNLPSISLEKKLKETRAEDLDIYVKSFGQAKLNQISEQLEKHKNIFEKFQLLEQQIKDAPKEGPSLANDKVGSQVVSIAHTQKNKASKEELRNSIITYFLFLEKLRNLILLKYITIHQVYEIFDSKYNPLDQNEEFLKEELRFINQIENEAQLQPNPFLINEQEFIAKFVNLMKSVEIFGINDETYIDYDDIYYFFNAFINIYPVQEVKDKMIQLGGQKDGISANIGIQQASKSNNQAQKMDKQVFLKKFSRYVEKNKSVYVKLQKQKNELIQLTENEKSFQQLQSLKKYTSIFERISQENCKEKPFKLFAQKIMNEILQSNDTDQRRKIKLYFEQLVSILKKKDPHYFSILQYFIKDLGIQQSKSVQQIQNSQKQPTTNLTNAFEQIGLQSKQSKEQKKSTNPQVYIKISQNLIWNQKLYYQILQTISDIQIEQQYAANQNKNLFQSIFQQQPQTVSMQQQQQDTFNNMDNLHNRFSSQVKQYLSKREQNITILLDCMEIINGLYHLNLKNSHAQILAILKKPSNIKITRNFLSFIKQSFSNYLQAIENLSNQDAQHYVLYQEKKKDLQNQEEIVLQVLKVIQNSCELCNEEFQNFFRTQNIISSQSYVPLNILNEILYFMTNFTQLKCSYFNSFDQSSQGINCNIFQGQNLKYYLVINQCISTLKNLCNGTSPKNKELLLSNSHFLVQLNAIITESDLDLQSENLKDVRILQTVSNCIDLLLTIIVCSNNEKSLLGLITIMNIEKLIKLLNFIYHYKIKSRLEIIQQEQMCTHKNSNTCSTSVCYKKCITYHDQLVMRLAFNIVIVIELILDKVNEEDLNMKMRMQEENSYLLGILLEMKKKEDFFELEQAKLHSGLSAEASSQNSQSIQKNSEKLSQSFGQKKLYKNQKTAKKISTKKSTTLHNLIYSEIKDDQSSKQDEIDTFYQDQLVHDIGVQREVNPSGKINYYKKERLYLIESLSFYLQFVGSVEIVQEKQISKLFFRIPLLSSYLTHNIRKNLIQKAVNYSDKNRLKLLMRYSEYFQHEMRFCQNLSKYSLIIQAVEYRNTLNIFIFLLIVAINLIFLFKMQINPDGSTTLSTSQDIIFSVLKLIHIILTFVNMLIVAIERYPVVTYQKYIELKQNYRNNIISTILRHKLVSFIFDFDFIYYLIYLILAIVALDQIVIYSVLLIDIVKLSEDLTQIIKITKLNLNKLIKTTLLCFLIIFIYSLIGAVVFPNNFSDAESFGSVNAAVSTLDFYFFFSTSLLEGILNPQGINEALTIPGVSSNIYWDRLFYDVSFWIIINFLFMDLMLGQIIDSYAQFRYFQRKYEKNIKRKCFICSLTVEDLEAKTLDWEQHIKYEHNLNNYLNYIIYIKSKPLDECDGIEKYVKESISKEITDFYPQRTSLLQERLEIKY
ncbi:hypothetical protein ABPG72_001698 [Tetrahymena utriculariae]